MRITIGERFKPYSHIPGTPFILPGSSLCFRIYPTLIRINNLENGKAEEIKFTIPGPLEDFTIQQDLEAGLLRVWGKTEFGFVRYKIIAQEKGFTINVEKAPKDVNVFPIASEKASSFHSMPAERLSLGVTKAQDWTLMIRRRDLAEIFPLWFRLGQSISYTSVIKPSQATLWTKCCEIVEKGTPDIILKPFEHLFTAAFEGGLSPRLEDTDFQGFSLPVSSFTSPLPLLSEGAKLIRSLFLQVNNEVISILPALPSAFHCGRMLNITCVQWGTLDLEWTKKKIRRMIFRAQKTGDLSFIFQKNIKKFRLRTGNKDRGKYINSGSIIRIEEGQAYWFDNFEQ